MHKQPEYEPDFVVETATAKYLCEPKATNAMQDDGVQAKARAAYECAGMPPSMNNGMVVNPGLIY